MAAADSEADPLIGQVLLGKLDVLRAVGQGGMGSVYEVEHLITHHRRALKIIKPELVKRRTYMKRLIREAGVAGTLNTPYVVDTYDAGTLEDGSVYILMELLEGRTLYDVIKRDGEIAVPRLISIVAQVCEGVGVAHRAGIIHRDLKPDNVFLLDGPGGTDQVKIMDFGISKFEEPEDEVSRLTSEGVVLGTPFYMSPEQARGKELDPRSDVYAVGVMMYEALTGRLPFEDSSISALFIKIAAGEYLPLRHLRPEIPEELAAVVEKAMHRKRDARYASMDELRASLLPLGGLGDKVRAKTLSEHPIPRSTASYGGPATQTPEPKKALLSSKQVPKIPGATPANDVLLSEPPPTPVTDSTRAPAAPETGSSRAMWMLLAAGLAIVIAVGVALGTGSGEEPDAETEETVADEEPRDTEPPVETAEMQPEEPPPVAAMVTMVTVPVPPTMEAEPDPPTRMRRSTPAERAGLELDPYGN
ncbi:MAG: protein kinase [Deltaproteobacteria bacterium]|nr:protein kinase [Deltaproteobacteria bacterium]